MTNTTDAALSAHAWRAEPPRPRSTKWVRGVPHDVSGKCGGQRIRPDQSEQQYHAKTHLEGADVVHEVLMCGEPDGLGERAGIDQTPDPYCGGKQSDKWGDRDEGCPRRGSNRNHVTSSPRFVFNC